DGIRAAARQLGITLVEVALDPRATRAAFDDAFARLADEKVGAVQIPGAAENVANLATIAELTAAARLPAIYTTREYPDLGGLMSYGVDQAALFAKCADYVVRILNGANPGDLPIQLPTTFEFVINLRTAKTFGLNIPQAVLARATEVIE